MRLFLLSLFISTATIAQTYNAFSIGEAIDNKETVTSIKVNNPKDYKLSLELTKMPKLEELDLSGLSIQTLPEFISQIKTLKRINLSNNPGLDINQIFGVLSKLQLTSLSLEGCKLPFLPFQIGDIKTLTQLNLSNNYIKLLPSTLIELENLEYLNLAMNYLDSIYAPINSLRNLKVLDLSFNENAVIDHLILSEIDFPALDEIKLVGVKHFPSTLNNRRGKLGKIDLSMTDFKDIKQLTVDSFQVDYVIANDCKKLDYDFLCKSLERSGVKMLELADKDMVNLPKGIHRMKSLEELTVGKSAINYVPSLNNHKKLKKITVNSNELNTIYSSVKSLPNLEYLNIKKTGVDADEVIKLIDRFPHAEIVYNSQKIGKPVVFPDYLKDLDFKAPFKNLIRSFEAFKINSKSKRKIKLASGTNVTIEPNSFQTKNNKPYNGEVVFEIKEIKSSLEIFISGLPMVYDSSAVYGFESGGMYVMKATTASGKELSLRDNKFINVNTVLPDDNGGFETYELNDKNKWVNNGLVPNTTTPGQLMYRANPLTYQNTGLVEPKLLHDGVALEIWKTKVTKGYNLVIKGSNGVDFKRAVNSGESISLSHFSKLSNQTWIIIDPEGKAKIKRMIKSKNIKKIHRVSYSKNPKYIFDNIIKVTLIPQVAKDNFLLKIVTETEVLELEIIQELSNVGPKSSKRKISKQWKRFKKQEKKREELNVKLRMAWENSMKNYQKRFKKAYSDSVFKANNPEEYAAKEQASFDYNVYQNSLLSNVVNTGDFKFTGLLACNIDRLNSELLANGKQTFYKPVDSRGEALELESVTVMSTVLGRTMTYTGDMVYLFDKSKTIIMGKTLSGDLAYMNASTVKEVKKGKDGKSIFKFKVINPRETSLEKLQKLTLQ
jgi:Leucine-rich repeat (LRR) protein